MIQVKNLLRAFPGRKNRPEEHIQELFRGGGITIEGIITYGKVTLQGQWYDDPRTEFVMVLSGEAELLFEENNQRAKLGRFDYVIIPPHERHRIEWVGAYRNTLWLTAYIENSLKE